MDDLKKKQLTILIKCCICIGCSIGMVSNCIGLFYTPIAQALGTGRGQIAAISTIISLSSAFSAQIVARLIKKIPINLVMGCGSTIVVLGFIALSFARQLPVFYVIAVFMGAGDICFKSLTISMVLRSWYGEKSGSKLGIAMALSGIVAAIMNPILGRVIEAYGYAMAFRLLALLIGVLAIPTCFSIRLNESDQNAYAAKKKSETAEKTVVPFIILAILTTLPVAISGATGMNTHFSSFAISLGYTLSFGATLVSFQSIFNSVWKLVFGFIADRLGYVRTSVGYLAMNIAACLIMVFFSGSKIAIIAGTCIYAAAFSLNTVGLPILIQGVAKERFAEVFANATMVQTIFYALFTTLFGTISDKAGSYIPCLLMVIVFSAIGMVMFAIVGKKTHTA
ncbi:MAG: MFS transporter [Firmicutes bacterium]|nr:MFS transporter [Bacillota bacterium]